jgi:hypothetical protein
MSDIPRLHSGLMEIAVVALIGYRENTIVPNISYGWGLAHEADLICVNPNMYVTEIEIKVTASDLKADFSKWHKHKSKKIHSLVYAVPEKLVDLCKELAPSTAGIIEVSWNEYLGKYKARWVRRAKKNHNPPITGNDLHNLLRLSAMRIWTLKNHNYQK